MTFNNAAWAIDGPLTTAALARRQTFATSGGSEGIVSKGDLKVLPLATPGVGLRISDGAALLLNRYQSEPRETYTVLNAGEHTMQSGDMPGSQPTAKSYLVCVTIGDPEGSQVGHPWMGASDPPAGQESTFLYVRPWLIECPAGTEHFTELGLNFPALALARLDIPANTTTITDSLIVDLRKLALPKSSIVIDHQDAAGTNVLNGEGGVVGAYERWPNQDQLVTTVPEWAVSAKVVGFIEGGRKTGAFHAQFRARLEGHGATQVSNINEDGSAGAADRITINVGGEIPIPEAVRGQQAKFHIEGTPSNASSKNKLETSANNTTALLQVQFVEEAE